jgi:hypothetical protein
LQSGIRRKADEHRTEEELAGIQRLSETAPACALEGVHMAEIYACASCRTDFLAIDDQSGEIPTVKIAQKVELSFSSRGHCTAICGLRSDDDTRALTRHRGGSGARLAAEEAMTDINLAAEDVNHWLTLASR